MKLKLINLILVFAGFLPLSALAQLQIKGSVQSSLYSWENAAEDQQWDFYQNLNLRVAPKNNPNLYFQSYFRLSHQGNPSEWDERVYHTYVNLQSSNRKFEARVGRQFLYSGVINGTADALQVTAKATKEMIVKFVVGTEAPSDRKLDIKEWDSGNVLGGYFSYNFGVSKFDLSYFQKSRLSVTVWQLIGAAWNGKVKNNLYYSTQFDYNLEKSEYQGVRSRLTYYYNKWSFSGEFNSQKPRIYEDSYFNIFELKAFNQFRCGVTYQFGTYHFGLQNLFTDYYDENNNEVILTVGNRWGTIGLINQNGFAGDNMGLYGEIQYEFVQNLTLKVKSSHYSYDRRNIQIGEEATSFSGGLHYRPTKPLLIQVELQESLNSFYNNDLRGLFRLNYSFNN